jgi:hypothetical protein
MARTKSAKNNSRTKRNGNNGRSNAISYASDNQHASSSRGRSNRGSSSRGSSSHVMDNNTSGGEIHVAYVGTGQTPFYDPQSDPDYIENMGDFSDFMVSYDLKPDEIDEASAIMDALEAGRKSGGRSSGKSRR